MEPLECYEEGLHLHYLFLLATLENNQQWTKKDMYSRITNDFLSASDPPALIHKSKCGQTVMVTLYIDGADVWFATTIRKINPLAKFKIATDNLNLNPSIAIQAGKSSSTTVTTRARMKHIALRPWYKKLRNF